MSDTSTPHPDNEPQLLDAAPDRAPLTAALSRDGRSLTLLPTEDGGITLTATRITPLIFDRFQTMALCEAFASLPLMVAEPSAYQFQRGLGR